MSQAGDRTEVPPVFGTSTKLDFVNPQPQTTVGLPRVPRGDGTVSEPIVQFGYERRAAALSKMDLFGIKPCCDNWDDFIFMSMGQTILNSPRLRRYVSKRDRICIEDRVIKIADSSAPVPIAPPPVEQKFPPKPKPPQQSDYDYDYDGGVCALDSDVSANRCQGFYNVVITPSGPGPYQVAWSNNSFNTSLVGAIGVQSGFQATVTVTDANGCFNEIVFSLPELAPEISVTGSVTAIDDGSVELTSEVSGGYPDYSYAWYVMTDGDWVLVPDEDQSSVTVSSGGQYRLVVTDQYECEGILEYMST